MRDLDHLCIHGREIACPECVDDARAERLEREAQREVAAEMLTEEQQRHAETQRALIIANSQLLDAERERDEARALLRAVAQSGVAWTTPGYVVAQIDRATWDAVIDNGAEGVDIRGNLPPDPEAPRG